jgi:peroxiredoxin Q/BCP
VSKAILQQGWLLQFFSRGYNGYAVMHNWEVLPMLQIGDSAPLFTAESTQGVISLEQYLDKQNVILIFYPGDETPVCTKQLCAVQSSYHDFARADTVVFGINPAEIKKHEAFAQKFGYQFPLIYDEAEQIRKKYGVGKILGLFAQQRVVYIINKAGRIIYARKGNPSTEELLRVIKEQT